MAKKYFKIRNQKMCTEILPGFIMYLGNDNSILREDEINSIVDELRLIKVLDEQVAEQNI